MWGRSEGRFRHGCKGPLIVLEDDRGSSRLMTRCGSRGGSLRGVIPRARNTIGWMRGLDPVQVDVLFAAGFLVWFGVQILVEAHPQVRLVQALTGLAIAGAIVMRRRWMLQALLLACVAFVCKRVLIGDQAVGQGGAAGLLGMLLLFYGSGAFLEGQRAWLGLGISLVLGGAITLVSSSLLAAVFGDVAFVLLPFIVGRSRRLALAREHAEREQAERPDPEREPHVRTGAPGGGGGAARARRARAGGAAGLRTRAARAHGRARGAGAARAGDS